MKTTNIIFLVLFVIYVSPLFMSSGFSPTVVDFLFTCAIALIPGTYLVASRLGRPPMLRVSGLLLAAAYNAVAALVLGWVAVRGSAAPTQRLALKAVLLIETLFGFTLATSNAVSLCRKVRAGYTPPKNQDAFRAWRDL